MVKAFGIHGRMAYILICLFETVGHRSLFMKVVQCHKSGDENVVKLPEIFW